MKLNGLDKFILSHETDDVHYNSHFILKITGHLDYNHFEKTVYKLGDQIPLLRSTIKTLPWNYRRVMRSKAWFRRRAIIEGTANLNQKAQDEFCNRAFDLKKQPPLRFLLSKEKYGYQIIMSVHHSLCDGGGQALLLEEFLRVWKDEPVSKYATQTESLRFRNLLKKMGFMWKLKKIYANKPSLKKQRSYKMASLVDYPERTNRSITAKTYELAKLKPSIVQKNCQELKCTLSEYITLCSFKALKRSLEARKQTDPIMIYMPKNIRPDFRIRKSFQNILATILLVAKPKDIDNPEFVAKIQKKIKTFDLESIAPFIFRVLLPDRFTPPKVLKKRYKKMDQDPDNQTCTFFVSSGLLPRTIQFPKEWGNIQLSARGTLLKSPSMGFILTGFKQNEVLTLEYVQELYSAETVTEFEKNFLEEFTMVRYKSDPLQEPLSPQADLEKDRSRQLQDEPLPL